MCCEHGITGHCSACEVIRLEAELARARDRLAAVDQVITDMEGSILGDSERAVRMRERQGYRRIRAILRPPAPTQVIDLFEALKKSLEGRK